MPPGVGSPRTVALVATLEVSKCAGRLVLAAPGCVVVSQRLDIVRALCRVVRGAWLPEESAVGFMPPIPAIDRGSEQVGTAAILMPGVHVG